MDKQTPRERMKKVDDFFLKYGWIIAAACGIIAILFLLGTIVTLKQKIPLEGEEVKKVYTDIHLWHFFQNKYKYGWTMFVTIGVLFGGSICAALSLVKRNFASASSMLYFLAIPLLALSAKFFEESGIEYLSGAEFGWGAVCALAFSIIGAVIALSLEFSENTFITKQIAEDGVLIAAAFILNLIKIPLGATGGSANFQMLPLFIIALRHGPAHGLICGGIIYGLMTCLTDGYGFACYPFDYLIGFGSVMVVGFFRKLILSEKQTGYNLKGELFILLACTIATLIRFIGSTASSMIVYGVPTLTEAMAYNAIYIPVSGLIATAVLMGAYGPIAKINSIYPVDKAL